MANVTAGSCRFEPRDCFVNLLRPRGIYLDIHPRSDSIAVRSSGREMDGGDRIDVFEEYRIFKSSPVAGLWGMALSSTGVFPDDYWLELHLRAKSKGEY